MFNRKIILDLLQRKKVGRTRERQQRFDWDSSRDRLFCAAGFTLMELLVVAGIFALIIGVSFTVLSSSRLAVDVNESKIQAQESARKVMYQLNSELHLANPGGTQLYQTLTTQNIPPLTGHVIYFQIPLENPDRTLNLDPVGTLRWGAKTITGQYNLGQWISYSLDPNRGLLRSTHAAIGQPALTTELISAHVNQFDLSRTSATSELIDIVLNCAVQSSVEALTQALHTQIRMRN